MSDVFEFHDADALAELADDWRVLLAGTPRASFFHTVEWLQTYWHFFGREQDLCVLQIKQDNRTLGIVPLVTRKEHFRLANVRVLTYPLDDWGSFYGPISAEPLAALRHAATYLSEEKRDWDLIDLRWIEPSFDSIAKGESGTLQALQQAGMKPHLHVCKRTAVIDTLGTWENYLASRTAKFRSGLRRALRRTGELGHIEYIRFRPGGTRRGDDDPHWSWFEECVELASRSWQGHSSTGTTLSDPIVREFLRESHAQAVRLGMLDLNMLRLDGRLVAFAYNYHHLGYVYGLRVGYDPDLASVGVGKVLWANSLEDSFARGDQLYDIGPDTLEAKRHWWTRLIPVRAVAHYEPKSVSAQLIRATQWWHDKHDEVPYADQESICAICPG